MKTRYLTAGALLCALATLPLAGCNQTVSGSQAGALAAAATQVAVQATSKNATAQKLVSAVASNCGGYVLAADVGLKIVETYASIPGYVDTYLEPVAQQICKTLQSSGTVVASADGVLDGVPQAYAALTEPLFRGVRLRHADEAKGKRPIHRHGKK